MTCRQVLKVKSHSVTSDSIKTQIGLNKRKLNIIVQISKLFSLVSPLWNIIISQIILKQHAIEETFYKRQACFRHRHCVDNLKKMSVTIPDD